MVMITDGVARDVLASDPPTYIPALLITGITEGSKSSRIPESVTRSKLLPKLINRPPLSCIILDKYTNSDK